MFRNSAYCLKRRFRINRLFDSRRFRKDCYCLGSLMGEGIGSPIVVWSSTAKVRA